jgi:hypothetical protein
MKNIDNLFTKKWEIEKQIEEIQKNCKHPKEVIKTVKENEAKSTFVIRYVCVSCGSVLRFPTQEEIFKYLNDG